MSRWGPNNPAVPSTWEPLVIEWHHHTFPEGSESLMGFSERHTASLNDGEYELVAIRKRGRWLYGVANTSYWGAFPLGRGGVEHAKAGAVRKLKGYLKAQQADITELIQRLP